MTQYQATAAFIMATVADEELARDFKAAVAGRSFEAANADIVAFAKARGYDVDEASLDRLRGMIVTEARQVTDPVAAPATQDLSDDELMTANGGFFGALAGAFAATVSNVAGGNKDGIASFTVSAKDGYFDPSNRSFWLAF